MAQVQGPTPPGSQYGVAGTNWLRAILEQGQANKTAGYAPWKPSQVLMDWLRKLITKQEETKMGILNKPKEPETP